MRRFFIYAIQGYRWVLGPALHTLVPIRSGCRFGTTCSEYTIKEIELNGVIRGIQRGVVRLSKCHPFGGHSIASD